MAIGVSDSHTKHGLAAVRALRDSVIAASPLKTNPTAFSRFVRGKIRHDAYPPENAFLEMVAALEKKCDLFLPIGYWSNIYASRFQNKIEMSFLPAPKRAMETASNKIQLVRFAKRRRIPMPKTATIRKPGDSAAVNFFPCAVKSPMELMGKKVEYASNREELEALLKGRLKLGPQLVQEKLSGPGKGFFALYDRGELKAFFMHERIREYPAQGGVSSFAKSSFDAALFEHGRKLLDSLKWHGVAMVEFKDGRLLEVNPKFWGSLDLAISSGVNFPRMYIDLASGKDVSFNGYKYARFQWLLPEELWRIRTARGRLRAAGQMLSTLFNPRVKKDICKLSDPLPTVMRLGWSLWKI